MKKTMAFVIAAATVAMTLVSCSKDNIKENSQVKDQPQGLRTLTVSFTGATKTTPTIVDNGDGSTSTQPVWTAGDEILLADGASIETYTVTAEQDGQSTIEITTALQSTVKAVYPAEAAIESNNEITGVKVEADQDSTFASANICIAEETTTGTLSFQNATAVFKVEVPAHTVQLVVTSLGEIDEETGQRSSTVRPINTEGENDADKQVITVSVDYSDESTTCYVAVLVDEENPVLLANLNFDAVEDAGFSGAQGGFAPNYLKDTKGIEDPYSYPVATNTVYSVDQTFLHEYVVVGEKKWATLNVGATAEAPNGDYFAWGASEVAYETLSNDEFTFKSEKPSSYSYSGWDAESGFDDCNTPYYDGHDYSDKNVKYTIYNTNFTSKYILDLCDDAANANWGGSWRMPKKEEFIDLLGGTEGSFTYNFPAAGYGDGTDLEDLGDDGYYWSSSLFTGNAYGSIAAGETPAAERLWFSDGEFVVRDDTRCSGFSVRAISD